MALRILVDGDDPILRKKSRDITAFDGRLHQLLDDMHHTMTASEGVGLAAVQVGILRRAIVIDIDRRIELINPVILEQSNETVEEGEACLSFPGESGMVPRAKWVKVRAQDRFGNKFTLDAEDLLARAIFHEIDHLEGVVYKDRAVRMLKPGEEG